MKSETPRAASIRWPAILLGLVVVPVNAYWVTQMEMVRYSGHPTTVSLLFNAVFCVFVLALLNLALKQVRPGLCLRPGELLVVYTTASIASTIAGHGFMQMLMAIITYPVQFATPENDWKQLFFDHIPSWIIVADDEALGSFYDGESSFYISSHLRAWAWPVAVWSAFIVALVFVMQCISVLLRQQWTENEKLSYPVIQLPRELIATSPPLFRSRAMWVAFGSVAALDILSGLHFLWPSVPHIPLKLYQLQQHITIRPWNAVGWFPISFYPFAIGLGFFIPLGLSFSCWFFFLFFKAQSVLGSVAGVTWPGFPFTDEQSWGGYVGVLGWALWIGRRNFGGILRSVLPGDHRVDDASEPMSYRATFVWMTAALVFLVVLSRLMGMTVWVAVVFLLHYLVISTAITRIRAEVGSPVHDLHWIGSDEMFVRVLGTRPLGPRNLTVFSFYRFFNRAQYSHTMPHMLEGLKLAERADVDNRRLNLAMALAIVVAPVATFWACLHVMYQTGGSSAASMVWPGSEAFNRLQTWLTVPQTPDVHRIGFLGIGLGAALFLAVMRTRFVGWPFHPIGYAVSGSWSMHMVWFCIFIAWAAKTVILRHGGVKAYRNAVPFFLGMILGEFTVGSLWTILGMAFNIPTHAIWF